MGINKFMLMSNEEKTLAYIACEAMELYNVILAAGHDDAEDYAVDAMHKLNALREELGEPVYFAERNGRTAIINAHKILYQHST